MCLQNTFEQFTHITLILNTLHKYNINSGQKGCPYTNQTVLNYIADVFVKEFVVAFHMLDVDSI